MSEFVNRVSSDLNKRTLNVLDVTRDEETGEIKSMEVEVSRGDTPTVVGTPLDADVFNQIVRDIIKEELGSAVLTNNEKVVLDTHFLSLPSEVSGSTIELKQEGNRGSVISWASNKPSVINLNGQVVAGSSDQTVKLTATVGDVNDFYMQKEFNVLVKSSLTDSERVYLDIQDLYVPSRVDDDFDLDLTGTRGSYITWSSSNTSRIYISGGTAFVDCSSTDVTVTLTATVWYGDYETTEEFDVIVSGSGGSYTTSCSFSGYDISFDYFTSSIQYTTLTITADDGDGIKVEINNTYSEHYDISVSGDGTEEVILLIEEKLYNMPSKDGGYDFEVVVKNLNNEIIRTETITIAYI